MSEEPTTELRELIQRLREDADWILSEYSGVGNDMLKAAEILSSQGGKRLEVREENPGWPILYLDGEMVCDIPTDKGREIAKILSRQDGEREADLLECGHAMPMLVAAYCSKCGTTVRRASPPAPGAPEGEPDLCICTGEHGSNDNCAYQYQEQENGSDGTRHGGPPMTMGESELREAFMAGRDWRDAPEGHAWTPASEFEPDAYDETAFRRWLATREPDASGGEPEDLDREIKESLEREDRFFREWSGDDDYDYDGYE